MNVEMFSMTIFLKCRERSEGKVFKHCLRGIDRDMTMASCYLIAEHGKSAEDVLEKGREEAPRWATDQKRDPATGEPVQFQWIRRFERIWKQAETG